LNVAGQAQRKETEISGLMQLHALAASYQQKGLSPDWTAIRRAVLRSLPPYRDNLGARISFVATRSGGTDGRFLKDLAMFHQNFATPSIRASLPAALYEQLGLPPHHFLALAIWEAAYTCPRETLKGSTVCTWISASEVASLANAATAEKRAQVEQAERFLSQARLLLPSTGLSPDLLYTDNKLVKVFGNLDCRMARFVLSKPASGATVYTKPADVFAAFVEDLAAFPGASVDQLRAVLPSWAAEAAPPSPAMPSSSAKISGWALCVAPARDRSGGVRWVVVAIDAQASRVSLLPWALSVSGGSSPKLLSVEKFLKTW